MWSITSTFTFSISPTKPTSFGCCDRADLEERSVLAAEADRGLAVPVEPHEDVRVDLAEQNHLCDLDGLGVGDPQPLDELDLHPHPLHVVA